MQRGNLKKYQSKNPLQRFLIRRFLEAIGEGVRQIPHGPICEVGCGEGFVLKNLLEHGMDARPGVIGVDRDFEALCFASGFAAGAKWTCASVYELPFRDKQFQGLLFLEVMEHLEHPEKALKEIRRVSRSALISVPHEPFFKMANFLRGKNWTRWGNDPEHIQHWGRRSLVRFLESYGRVRSLAAPFPWLVARVEWD